jgi:radical SAM protein with 4Fe4S-binding SPASM domain
MSTRKVKAILDEAASLGCMTVRLTGGEPLLRPDFNDIYLYARKRGIKVTLFTNATLVTRDLMTLFKKYPPGEPIEITLYGMKKQSYEFVSRVKGSFATAMNGITLLVENHIPIFLKSIRLPNQDKDIDEFRKFAEKYSVDGKSSHISMDFNLRGRRDSEEKNRQISKLRATPQETLTIRAGDQDAYKKGQKQFVEKFMRPGGVDLFTCGCGKGGSVDAYGKLQPCLLLRHPDLSYDLEGGTIQDALNHFFPEVLARQAENPSYHERCAVCFLKGLCNQCPAWSWMENGTLDSPVEYLCEIAHQQARYLGLLKPGENAWQVKNWQERIDNFVKEGQTQKD